MDEIALRDGIIQNCRQALEEEKAKFAKLVASTLRLRPLDWGLKSQVTCPLQRVDYKVSEDSNGFSALIRVHIQWNPIGRGNTRLEAQEACEAHRNLKLRECLI